jgi:hypothetical protein
MKAQSTFVGTQRAGELDPPSSIHVLDTLVVHPKNGIETNYLSWRANMKEVDIND